MYVGGAAFYKCSGRQQRCYEYSGRRSVCVGGAAFYECRVRRRRYYEYSGRCC